MPKPAAPLPTQVVLSTEVRPTSKTRRTYTTKQKIRIVREASTCATPTEINALCRREGIYRSMLDRWRKTLESIGEEGLAARQTGRKPKLTAEQQRIVALERQLAQAEREHQKALELLALQKKVFALMEATTRLANL